MSGKDYQDWMPRQTLLLPASPLDWLPQGHLAYFVLDLVDQLDLSAIEDAIQSKDARGQRPYSPRMMTALLLYAYSVGVFSSRKIERATSEDIAFRVLAAGTQPHFTTVNQFRLSHREALAALFGQVLGMCRKAGLVRLGRVAIDGTKIKASASKHKAMSYGRMKQDEQRLQAEIEALLAKADQTDAQEDEQYGRGQSPEDLPAELQRRESRLARIRQAKAELEAEAAEARAARLRELAAEQQKVAQDSTHSDEERGKAARRAAKSEQQAQELSPKRDDDDDDGDGDGDATLPKHRVPATPAGEPKEKAQRNFTDPQSRIMVNHGAFEQAYNAQIVVDDTAQVIVAAAVTNQPPDQQHLKPMMARCIDNCGNAPNQVLGDSGYFSAQDVSYCEERGVDAYIAISRKNEDARASQKPATVAQQARQRMLGKLKSDVGRAAYARRKVIVEPVFGQIKFGRGFRAFLLRGLSKVTNEWSLVCTCHNLLKLFRATATLPTAAPA